MRQQVAARLTDVEAPTIVHVRFSIFTEYRRQDLTSLPSAYRGSLEGQGDLEWMLRNWHHFSWLSGDWIMEVTVHSVDKIAWVYGDVAPVRCVGTGARQQQNIGDVWDGEQHGLDGSHQRAVGQAGEQLVVRIDHRQLLVGGMDCSSW